jgi:hypothetical protein
MPLAQTIVQLLEQLEHRPLEERQRVRVGYTLATQLFAGRYRACGRPFVSHLIGTASALDKEGASIDMVLAGLLHAAYEQGEFPRGVDRRARLREAIGVGAEALVHRYQHFDTARVPDDISEAERDVVVLRIANELDECGDRGMRYVGTGKREGVLAGVSKYVVAARAYGMPHLADRLEALVAENAGEPEPGLAGEADGSYTLTPPLRTLIHKRIKAKKRKLKEARRAFFRRLRGR